MSYFVMPILLLAAFKKVSFSGLITLVGVERTDLPAIDKS